VPVFLSKRGANCIGFSHYVPHTRSGFLDSFRVTEDQAIAALLHDAVEDQGGGLPTLATIRHMFGDRVADTVESCSDSTESDATKKPDWRLRKDKYLEHLRTANADALIVSAADKLHNARAILADYRERGEGLGRGLMVEVQCAEA
jgi:(p)ppGpp synthase/HD superfamily hydrolase